MKLHFDHFDTRCTQWLTESVANSFVPLLHRLTFDVKFNNSTKWFEFASSTARSILFALAQQNRSVRNIWMYCQCPKFSRAFLCVIDKQESRSLRSGRGKRSKSLSTRRYLHGVLEIDNYHYTTELISFTSITSAFRSYQFRNDSFNQEVI